MTNKNTMRECLLSLEYLTMQLETSGLEEALDGLTLYKTKAHKNIVSLEAFEPMEDYDIAISALHSLAANISKYHSLTNEE